MADVSAVNGTNVTLYDEAGNRLGTTTNPLEVSVNDTIKNVAATEFARIEAKQYLDNEEVRFDIPQMLANGSIYVGVAMDGSLTSSPSWIIIRTYFDMNGSPVRKRIRMNVAWDNRTVGWL